MEILKEILRKHELWLNNKDGGARANLSETVLSGVDLSGANLIGANLSRAHLSGANLSRAHLSGANLSRAHLSGADLSGADLSGAHLSGANLSRANLSGACLCGANLSRANLSGACLSGANLIGANLSRARLSGANLSRAHLSGADLSGADLSGAHLSGANLSRANLSGACLSGANLSGACGVPSLACPSDGPFIGWKKAHAMLEGDALVKLLIPENAKRSSATTKKCRADKAEVLDIIRVSDGEHILEAYSHFNANFVYKVGETVSVGDFNDDRWSECAPGIHFFIDRQDAENWII